MIVVVILIDNPSLGQYKHRTPMSNPEVRLPATIEDPLASYIKLAVRSGDEPNLERHVMTLTHAQINRIIEQIPDQTLTRSGLKNVIVNYLRASPVSSFYTSQRYDHVVYVMMCAHSYGYFSILRFMLGPAMNVLIPAEVLLDIFCYGYGSILIEILRTHTFDQKTLNTALSRTIWSVSCDHPDVIPRLSKVKAFIEAGANNYRDALTLAWDRISDQDDVLDYLRDKLRESETV